MKTNILDIFSLQIKVELEGKERERSIYQIKIPRIQRPYAQGRKESAKYVRVNFLQSIFDCLLAEHDSTMDLNFIYGDVTLSKEPNHGDELEFHLLDGQQRFTTLYLLVWYLYVREYHEDDDLAPLFTEVQKLLDAFIYDTRIHTSGFCRMLSDLAETIKGSTAFEQGPQKLIVSDLNFVSAYKYDSTVDAMFNMLEAIHEKYEEELHSRYNSTNDYPIHLLGLLPKVKNIEFYLQLLNDYRLAEDLYIKMNARGLRLSPFACFKAAFLNHLQASDLGKKEGVFKPIWGKQKYFEYFGRLIDDSTEGWCDLFWNRQNADPEKFDLSYMRFFAAFFASCYILDTSKSAKGEMQHDPKLDFFYNKFFEGNDFSKYLGFKQFGEELESSFKNNTESYFEQILRLLDLVKTNYSSMIAPFTPMWLKPEEVGNIICQQQKGKFSLNYLVVLASVIAYVRHYVTEMGELNAEVYAEWIRVVNIIAHNTDLTDKDEASRTARNLRDIIRFVASEKPKDKQSFYQALSTYTANSAQLIRDECQKARRIIGERGDIWDEIFKKIESNKFLKGRISLIYDECLTLEQFINLERAVNELIWPNEPITDEAKSVKNDNLFARAITSRYDFADKGSNFRIELNTKDLYTFLDINNNKKYKLNIKNLFIDELSNLSTKGIYDYLKKMIEKTVADSRYDSLDWKSRRFMEEVLLNKNVYLWMNKDKKGANYRSMQGYDTLLQKNRDYDYVILSHHQYICDFYAKLTKHYSEDRFTRNIFLNNGRRQDGGYIADCQLYIRPAVFSLNLGCAELKLGFSMNISQDVLDQIEGYPEYQVARIYLKWKNSNVDENQQKTLATYCLNGETNFNVETTDIIKSNDTYYRKTLLFPCLTDKISSDKKLFTSEELALRFTEIGNDLMNILNANPQN